MGFRITTIAAVGLLLSGCTKTSLLLPQKIASQAHRIQQINDLLYDNLQIMLYSGRYNQDTALANRALDGCFSIIGQLSEQEIAYAKIIDHKALDALLGASKQLLKEKQKLITHIRDDQQALALRYQSLQADAACHTWTKRLVAFASLVLGVIAIAFIVFRVKV